MKILQKNFLTELEKISTLSEKVNINNKQKILEMIKAHSEEIPELYFLKDDHWAICLLMKIKILILFSRKVFLDFIKN